MKLLTALAILSVALFAGGRYVQIILYIKDLFRNSTAISRISRSVQIVKM